MNIDVGTSTRSQDAFGTDRVEAQPAPKPPSFDNLRRLAIDTIRAAKEGLHEDAPMRQELVSGIKFLLKKLEATENHVLDHATATLQDLERHLSRSSDELARGHVTLRHLEEQADSTIDFLHNQRTLN